MRAAGQAVEHKAYHALRRSHVTDHAALFGGVKIDLGTSPAAALPTDERIAAGKKIGGGGSWSRTRVLATSPIPAGAERLGDIEQALRAALTDAGVKVNRIETQVLPISPNDPRLRYVSQSRIERLLR
ncbi:hypothetical protein, partial [Pseudomonas sp. EL_65y_Pfl1_R83]|uniref:hypothetical protein n=1 Tax=Pseudomonas sp. EL_65y_Pfl1_R83 TaxID=3088697 RepID=UPI0030DB8F4B